jgi:glycosyltransferase involved in cell wall biosynthesis
VTAVPVSVVVIGRNEGERLTACLKSIRAARMSGSIELIYVDSGSSDGSPERAAALGAKVIGLGAGKQSAARARNAGWHAARSTFVLFLDGDTILHPDFVDRALMEFADPDVAVVWGHRREVQSDASIYNRVLDLDWIAPPGYSDFCGGDSLMRRATLESTNGFNPDLIAGEEPDLCRRIRATGGRILHIDAPMTGHDLAILHVSQYWRRAVRTGYAYAEISARYRETPDPLWIRESRGNLLRGLSYVVISAGMCAMAIVLRSWIPLFIAVLAVAALAVRTAILSKWKSASLSTLLLFGIHSHVQHVPILQGQLLYLWNHWRGRGRELIEYKTGS